MNRADIARRARAELGTPYRLHGRLPGRALDCIGLIAVAIAGLMPDNVPVPAGYAMRGYYETEIADFFKRCGFDALPCESMIGEGDIVATRPGPGQWHLVVAAGGGMIHADAGLRRVTFLPGGPPWPVAMIFRYGRG